MGPCLRRGTSYLSEAGVQRLARVEQFLDRVDRDLEARLVGTVEFDLDDLLDPARADLHRHANIEAIDAVLAVDKRGAGQDALLVTEVRFGHRDARSRGRIESRSGAEQRDAFAAAAARSDRKSTRLNYSHQCAARTPPSA